VTGPAVALIEALRIDAVQLPHAEGTVAVRGLHKEIIMVGHEAVGITEPVVAFVNMLEGVQKILAVRVVLENALLHVPAGDPAPGY